MFASLLLTYLLLNSPFDVENRGLIPLGNGEFGDRAAALERGLFEYHGRWYPPKMRKKLEAWEKQDAKSVEWGDAYKTKSKNYRIETNVPRFIVELEIKPFLDELFKTYVRVFKTEYGLKGSAVNQNEIRIYNGYADYAIHENEPRGTPAFFTTGRLVAFYDDNEPGEFYNSIFHEGAHQFFTAMLPGATLPIWLDEALATYFEAGSYSRSTGEIDFSGLPVDRVVSAKHQLSKLGKDIDLGPLFLDVPAERFDAPQYALAWSFVHYLIHRDEGKQKGKFAKFLNEMNGAGTRPVEDVFRKMVREELSDHAGPWRDYVLAMEAPLESGWIYLAVENAAADEDLRDGDRLFAIDGIGIYSGGQFESLWTGRSKERPCDVTVIRKRPAPPPVDYEEERLTISIAPDSKIGLDIGSRSIRSHNLRE